MINITDLGLSLPPTPIFSNAAYFKSLRFIIDVHNIRNWHDSLHIGNHTG